MQLQKSLEQHQKIPKYLVVQHIGVRAAHFLGVRRIFARILPNLTEKLNKKRPPKKSSSCCFGRHIWSYFQRFAQIFRDFVKAFRDFTQISTDFSQILRDFHQIKTSGAALAPSRPTPGVVAIQTLESLHRVPWATHTFALVPLEQKGWKTLVYKMIAARIQNRAVLFRDTAVRSVVPVCKEL